MSFFNWPGVLSASLLGAMILNPASVIASDCDADSYERPAIEEFFNQDEKEIKIHKVLKKLCLEKNDDAVVTSKASWYADKFHGRSTASGEIYDHSLFTAAHRTAPFGSYVLVTNRANDKEIVVRVNDRGPFIVGRDLDLSQKAAAELGITNVGVGQIDYQILEDKRE